MKPIRAFVGPRAQAVADQLAGKPAVQQAQGGGFGPRGPGGFGPAMFLLPAFTAAMDADKDGAITKDEFSGGFAKWFEAWGGKTELTEAQVRAGIDRDFSPARGGFGPPGF